MMNLTHPFRRGMWWISTTGGFDGRSVSEIRGEEMAKAY